MLEEYLELVYDLNNQKTIEELNIYHELLEVLKEVSNNFDPKNKTQIKKLYMRYLKASLKLNTNRPSFESDYNCTYENCYMYALGLNTPKIFSLMWEKFRIEVLSCNVGFTELEKRESLRDKDKLLERFYTDCENLEIDIFDSDINTPPEHGGYKIAIYMSKAYSLFLNGYDFHFVRQNYDESWSEKHGRDGDIILLDDIEHKWPYDLVKVIEVVKPVVKERVLFNRARTL